MVKAVLMYTPVGLESEIPVPIGATDDPRVLRVLRDQLLKTAAEQAAMWRDVDAGLYVMKLAEAEALGRVLRVILPDEELRALRLVKEEE